MPGTPGVGRGDKAPGLLSCRRLCNHILRLHLSLDVAQMLYISDLAIMKAVTCMLKLVLSISYIHVTVGPAAFLILCTCGQGYRI